MLACAGAAYFKGPSGKPVKIKPAMIEMIRLVPDTTLSMIDATTVTLGDPPERIIEEVTRHPRSLLRGAWAYIHVRYALESGRSPQDLPFERTRAILDSISNPEPTQRGLWRLAQIYWDILSPLLNPFKIFRRGGGA